MPTVPQPDPKEAAIRKVEQQELRAALRLLMVTGTDFASQFITAGEVRVEYMRRLRAHAADLAAAAARAQTTQQLRAVADEARGMRNVILDQLRSLDRPAGQAAAILLKPEGRTLLDLIAAKMKKLSLSGPFEALPDSQQGNVYREIIQSATRDNRYVSSTVRVLAGSAYALLLGTILVSAYDIGTSRHPWWQAKEYAATLAGGAAGQAAGSALGGVAGEAVVAGVGAGATRAAAFGPLGVFIGGLVGGLIGSLIGGRIYVGVAGVDDAATEQLLRHFTIPFVGYPELDTAGLARALVLMSQASPDLVVKVLLTLTAHYSLDADDVALAYAVESRDRRKLEAQSIAPVIRETLVRMLESGWIDGTEHAAIGYLMGTAAPLPEKVAP
jgi:hypothetical protein